MLIMLHDHVYIIHNILLLVLCVIRINSLMNDILIGHITVDLVLILSQEFCFIS